MPGQDGLNFDGDGDYVVLPTLQFDGRPPWTLEAIVKPMKIDTADGWASLVSAAEVGSIALDTFQKKWAMEVYKASAIGEIGRHVDMDYSFALANTEVELNHWQHVAGVWDGKELRIYINGRLQETRSKADYCTRLSELPFFLGADPNGWTYSGVASGELCGRLRAAPHRRRRIQRILQYPGSS